MCLCPSHECRLAVRGQPTEADRRRRPSRQDSRRPQRHRPRGIPCARRRDAGPRRGGPSHEDRLRGATGSDQGHRHAHPCVLPGVAGRRPGRAHYRSDRRGSAVRAPVPAPNGEARSRARDSLRKGAADRAHLFRDRHPGPHELQRRATARHSGGQRRGDSGGCLRRRGLSRSARGAEQRRSTDRSERHRDAARRPRGNRGGDRSTRSGSRAAPSHGSRGSATRGHVLSKERHCLDVPCALQGRTVAGIGWRLERLIHRGISGATAAYATGAAVMALPWVLTTAVLVSLPAIIGRGMADPATAGTVVNVAYAVALFVAGPVQIVISRYAADRLYEGRFRAIAAPFCRGLGGMFLICAVPATLTLLALGLPPRFALWGASLSAAVGAQWTALSVGNGLCSPALVLGAVGAGSALSFLLAVFFVAVAGLGVPGYLFGLISGQTLTLVILLVGILRSLPGEVDERARLLPAFRDYAALAGAGLAFNACLYVDKLIAWCLVGGETAALHAGASTIAWFSTIPCLAWIFVEVETRFHRRFRRFYLALEGGAPLAELRRD